MVKNGVEISEFLNLTSDGKLPVIDGRSESEFQHANIPGSVNLPILTNAERIEIGTTYRQKGREAAVLTGFRLVGPRFHEIIIKAKELAPGKEVVLYCWRGGMRSQILSWLLQMNGFRVVVLKGGYKVYRNWVLDIVNRPLKAVILGGPTGSGKTDLLDKMIEQGEQVLQLEKLANHKGSAFGGLGMGAQPSTEQFENLIAMEWYRFDSNKPVWIENESRSIGSCMIPAALYNIIRNSMLFEIQIGKERRKKRILNEYGAFPAEVLGAMTEKIGKRLGPQHVKQSLLLLNSGDIEGWLDIVLDYYDKLYAYGSTQRPADKYFSLDLEHLAEKDFVNEILLMANEQLSVKRE